MKKLNLFCMLVLSVFLFSQCESETGENPGGKPAPYDPNDNDDSEMIDDGTTTTYTNTTVLFHNSDLFSTTVTRGEVSFTVSYNKTTDSYPILSNVKFTLRKNPGNFKREDIKFELVSASVYSVQFNSSNELKTFVTNIKYTKYQKIKNPINPEQYYWKDYDTDDVTVNFSKD